MIKRDNNILIVHSEENGCWESWPARKFADSSICENKLERHVLCECGELYGLFKINM